MIAREVAHGLCYDTLEASEPDAAAMVRVEYLHHLFA
jgi:hypothetical protein